MDEMTSFAAIAKILGYVFGSSLVTLIISKRLDKKTNDVKNALLEQEFYQKLNADYKKELAEIKDKLTILTEQNKELIKRDEINSKTIEDQLVNLKKWENYCEQLKVSVKERDKTNSLLIKEIELLESKK